MIRDFITFARHPIHLSLRGTKLYYAWLVVLAVLVVAGGNAYMRQFVHGLGTTGLTDQVAWGAYIANFSFLVGVSASVVMLVIPAYVYGVREMRDVVIIGELLSFTALIMALAFVMVDIGKPIVSWHMVPFIGILNLPDSLLAWDVVALAGYLALNGYICVYFLFNAYIKRKPTWIFYGPFIFVSIVWAVSVLAVSSFIYVGLVGRPLWNVSILSPRFMVSAFIAGPALLILAFQIVRQVSDYKIDDRALSILRQIVTASLLINLFLLCSELFTEFYSGKLHNISTRYLYLGIEHHGHLYDSLVAPIWAATLCEIAAAIILITPLRSHWLLLNAACVFAIFGIWVEKGAGVVVAGFIPTPLGDVVEYFPTLNETLVCVGIWAFGALMYTLLLKISIPILLGKVGKHPLAGAEHDG